MQDRHAIEHDWGNRGFSCGLWIDPPGQCWENYVHRMDELVLVLEGSVEFEIGGVSHRPEPGVELLIPAGVAHTVRNLGGSVAHWLYGYKMR